MFIVGFVSARAMAWQQHAQQAWGQQQQQQQPYGSNKDVTLVVTGCTHATVGGIVRGTFQLIGENHGKPTYKKDGQVNGLDVMTYFWDERDGPAFSGWWFGPKVGGDQVWAYHSDKGMMPPQQGWKVPYDGPVDPTFVIQAKPKQGAQQQWGGAQQQWDGKGQQKGGQQQQWGGQHQQQKGGQQQQKGQQKGGWQQHQQNMQQAAQNRDQQAQWQKQQMEEKKQQLEQANQLRIAQQKQQAEQRAAEQAKKAAEMEAKKAEQQAVLAIRRAMQTLRTGPPEKFDENKAKLEEVVANETDKTGSQKERMKTEVEAAVKETVEKNEKQAEMKRKQEEDREKENARRKEMKEKATGLMEELDKLIEKAEGTSKKVAEVLEPLSSDKDMKIAEIDKCADTVEEAAKTAETDLEACSAFLRENQNSIKGVPQIQGEEPHTLGADLQKLTSRIAEAKKLVTTSKGKCNTEKTTRVKKVNAKQKFEEGLKSFKKADTDKDGKLSRKEVTAWAKATHKFAVPADTLDTIQRVLVKDGAKGVDQAEFFKMQVLVGVAREAELDKKRREEREAREKEVAELKVKLEETIKGIGEQITAAVEAAGTAEKEGQAIGPAQTKDLKALEVIAKAEETEKVLEESKATVTKAKEAVKALTTEEPELKGFLAGEVKKLNASLNPLESKLNKANQALTKLRDEAKRKDTVELAKFRKLGLDMIHFHQGVKKLLMDDVYALFDKKKAGKVEEAAFVAFFKACEKKSDPDTKEEAPGLSEEDSKRLFKKLVGAEASISQDDFMALIRKYMKVVKASVLTEEIGISSKTLRRLEDGEILEVLTGPQKENDDSEVERLKVKATNDDMEGWVTPVGNQGTVFLKEGGNMFKVVKETILTGSFVIGDDATGQKDRKLKVGEVVEVQEWAKKEEKSGLMRMKVRVKSDGQLGYATSVGNTGIKFLEVM